MLEHSYQICLRAFTRKITWSYYDELRIMILLLHFGTDCQMCIALSLWELHEEQEAMDVESKKTLHVGYIPFLDVTFTNIYGGDKATQLTQGGCHALIYCRVICNRTAWRRCRFVLSQRSSSIFLVNCKWRIIFPQSIIKYYL